ncbi:MAG: hypothetical protein JWO13_3305 [Acidobacteriales bacterium]|nr:hypothetical protein [Terriglobales bacterium]
MTRNNVGPLHKRTWLFRLICLVLLTAQTIVVPAQQPAPQADSGRLPQDSGLLGLQNMLRKLHTTARLLQTTAHPDDEDGGMLVYESRFKGADVMLMTLTRGDGGQNKTGSNFFDELGVLRTLELLESDKYYGVQQRFSRVADFGFSKTAAETFEKWGGKDVPMADMVRVIRTFRPDVVVSRFSGTPRDGHGNHQAVGILTPEAVAAAADPNRFPEQIKEGLLPWRVKKLYVGNRGSEDYTVRIDAGQVYPPLGMSFAQFGILGYSQQKSQNARVFDVPPGPNYRSYKLVEPAPVAGTHEQDFFDGIDTTIPGLVDFEKVLWDEDYKGQITRESVRKSLEEISAKVDEATLLAKSDPVKAAVPLLAGKRMTSTLLAILQPPLKAHTGLSFAAAVRVLDRLHEKEQQFQDAANLALGLALEARVHTARQGNTVIPGENFGIAPVLQNTSGAAVAPIEDFKIIGMPTTGEERMGLAVNFPVRAPLEFPLTRPFWHREDPERQNVFTIDNSASAALASKGKQRKVDNADLVALMNPKYPEPSKSFDNLPLPPDPVHVIYRYKFQGEEGEISTVPGTADGRLRKIAVVPAFSVLLEHAAHVIQTSSRSPIEVKVTVQKNFIGAAKPTVRLNVPAGWRVSPASQPAEFASAAGARTVSFTVTPGSLKEGNYDISAAVDYNNKSYKEGFTVVGREDLDTFYYYQPATQRVSVVDVKTPANLKVAYIMGAGDDIPPVLQNLGIDLKLLTPDDVEHTDLSQFGTIILGIRAYDTRDDVKKNNKRLLDYVSNGGTLIVQNNFSTDDFNKGNFTPYPAQLSRERVSVEEAPVQILAPDDPLFSFPNKISSRDFDGWVQERGVNFMSTWDDHFQPLLASGDPGEAPLKGGMLRAKFGKGTYIYTGYAFFRQLPSGVPGAIRLYVNLISAGHEAK